MSKQAAPSSQLFDRKSIESVVAETETSGLRRALGALDLTSIGIAAIIGAGIFGLLGVVAREVSGPAVILGILIAGIAAVLSALTYAEFASLIPVSGSAYTYAFAALGRLPAFLIGWLILLAYAVGNMTVAIIWSDFLTAGLSGLGLSLPRAITSASPDGVFDLPAALIVLVVVGLCLLKIRESTAVNNFLVALKLVIILFVILFGLTLINVGNYEPFVLGGATGMDAVSRILRGAAIIFFAYLGFDTVAATAEEARNPRRDLPLGILLSVGVCMVLYLSMGGVVSGLVPAAELTEDAPVADAFTARGHPWAAAIIIPGTLLALTTVLYAFQLALTRILFAMARDGFLPGVFASVNARTGTPWNVNLAAGALTVLGAGLMPLLPVADMTSEASFAIYILVAIGVLVLRVKRPDAPRRIRVPWLVPALVIALMLLIAALGIPGPIHLDFAAWVGLGLLVYGFYAHRRSVRAFTPQ